MAVPTLTERVEAVGLSESALPAALAPQRLQDILSSLESLTAADQRPCGESLFGRVSLCAGLNSFLVSRGCPSHSLVENSFVAAGEHSELGLMLRWFAGAVVGLFVDGVRSGVSFPQAWAEALRNHPTLNDYMFELQGFGALFTFLLCQLAAVECTVSKGGASGNVDDGQEMPLRSGVRKMKKREGSSYYSGEASQDHVSGNTQEHVNRRNMARRGSQSNDIPFGMTHKDKTSATATVTRGATVVESSLLKDPRDGGGDGDIAQQINTPSATVQCSSLGTSNVNDNNNNNNNNNNNHPCHLKPMRTHVNAASVHTSAKPSSSASDLRLTARSYSKYKEGSLEDALPPPPPPMEVRQQLVGSSSSCSSKPLGPTLLLHGTDSVQQTQPTWMSNVLPQKKSLHCFRVPIRPRVVRPKNEGLESTEDNSRCGMYNVSHVQFPPSTNSTAREGERVETTHEGGRLLMSKPKPLRVEDIEQRIRARELCKMYNVESIVNYSERDKSDFKQYMQEIRGILDTEFN